MRARALFLAAGAATLFLPCGPGVAQGVLLDARMQVILPSPGESVQVQASYKVQPQAGADEIPLSLLAPAPTRIQGLRASLSEENSAPSAREGLAPSHDEHSAFYFEEIRDYFSEGSVRLTANRAEGGDPLFLHLSYSVEGAWTGGNRATLPLLVPRWVPAEPIPRTFLARVEVPQGRTIVGSFPTSVLERPPPGAGGVYEVGLQGVPSMLILEVVEGRGTFFTLERGLDLFVVLILLVMGAFGVRYLRGMES